MGMSTHVVGYKPRDDEWEAKLKVYNSCIESDTELPDSIQEFFEEVLDNGDDPNETPGSEVDVTKCGALSVYSADMQNGYDIDISKLPPDVKVIRVYNSY